MGVGAGEIGRGRRGRERGERGKEDRHNLGSSLESPAGTRGR